MGGAQDLDQAATPAPTQSSPQRRHGGVLELPPPPSLPCPGDLDQGSTKPRPKGTGPGAVGWTQRHKEVTRGLPATTRPAGLPRAGAGQQGEATRAASGTACPVQATPRLLRLCRGPQRPQAAFRPQTRGARAPPASAKPRYVPASPLPCVQVSTLGGPPVGEEADRAGDRPRWLRHIRGLQPGPGPPTQTSQVHSLTPVCGAVASSCAFTLAGGVIRTVTVSSKSRAGGRTRRAQAPRPSPTPGGGRAWGLRLRPGDGGARARAGASVPDPPVTDPSAACPLLGAWDQPSQPRFRCWLLCSDTQAGVAPAGPGRSRWPSSMAVTEHRGRWSPAPPEAFPLAAPVGPGRRPRSEGVPAWSAQSLPAAGMRLLPGQGRNS